MLMSARLSPNASNKKQYDITFETKCYENDWEYLLKTKYLDNMILNCNVPFAFRQIIINNVNGRGEVAKWAELKKQENIIDDYYFATDYEDKAFCHFGLEKDSFGKGYYYSNSELVGLFLSKTKYHLHFSSDAFIPHSYRNSDWIYEACDIMEKHSEYVVANPTWNLAFNDAKKEASGTIGNFFTGYGFSDQCYMVNTKIFQGNIYNFVHPDSERYPKYAGELFEKRVDSFMRTHNLCRLTSCNTSYTHCNFPRNSNLSRKLVLILIAMDLYVPYTRLRCCLNKAIPNPKRW